MAGEVYGWEGGARWEVGGDGCADAGDYCGGRAFEEDFAYEVGVVCGCGGGCVREVREGEGECEVLFSYYTTGDSLVVMLVEYTKIQRTYGTYRTQNGIHKSIHILWSH